MVSVLICTHPAQAQQNSKPWTPDGLESINHAFNPGVFSDTSEEHKQITSWVNKAWAILNEDGNTNEVIQLLLKAEQLAEQRGTVSRYSMQELFADAYFRQDRFDLVVKNLDATCKKDDSGKLILESGRVDDAMRYAVALSRVGQQEKAQAMYQYGVGRLQDNGIMPLATPVVFQDSPYASRYTPNRLEAAARTVLARELELRNLPNRATAELKKAIALRPNDPDAYYYLGLVYAQKFDKINAEKQFKQADSLGLSDVHTLVATARKRFN